MPITEPYERRFDETIPTAHTAEQAGCPECNGHVVTSDGETACIDCGLVLDDQRIDHRSKRGWYEDGEGNERERTGAPLTPTRHDRGLTTDIGRYRDANGNRLSGAKRRQLARLRREHKRGQWQSTADRNLADGLGDIRRLVSALELPSSICDRACTLFRSAQDADLLRGRSIEAVAAACIHAACRCRGLPRTIEEVVAVTPCDRSDVRNAYHAVNVDLSVAAMPPVPQIFLHRFAVVLELPPRIERRAVDLVGRAQTTGLANGRNPAGVAAACLYTAADAHGWSLCQSTVADVANVSVPTLRTSYQALRNDVEA